MPAPAVRKGTLAAGFLALHALASAQTALTTRVSVDCAAVQGNGV